MEEKNVTKISLTTFFLILAIIVIIVMGIFIYKLYNDKTVEIQKSTELQAQVNSLNATISDLQEKIDKVSETINSKATSEKTTFNNTISNNTNSNNTNIKDASISFTDEQVKTACANYLELEASAGCASLLECLTRKGDLNYDVTKDLVSNKDNLHVTNIKFDDYKKAMLNYVSENEFEKNWTSSLYVVKNDDGYLLRPEGGGGYRSYTIRSISKLNDTTYSVKTSSVVEDNEYYEENIFTFTIKSYNGKCVIDSVK